MAPADSIPPGPAAATAASDRPSAIKRIVTIVQAIGQLLIVALLATTLSGIPKGDPSNTKVEVERLSDNYFQGLSGSTSSTGVSAEVHQFYNFQDVGIHYLSTFEFNGVYSKTDMYGVYTYKPCKLYQANTNSQSSRKLEVVDTGVTEDSGNMMLQTFSRRLDNSTADDDGQKDVFCTQAAPECAAKGDAAAASFVLAFILALVCAILTSTRIGKDDGMKTWISIFAHILTIMFTSVGVGSFSNGCVNNAIDSFQKQNSTVSWEWEILNGTIFNVAITAIVFSIVQIILTYIFRYQEPASSAQQESGIAAPAAAPAATKV